MKEDATEILRVDLPESTTPTLDEPCEECPTPEPQAWVRQEDVPEKVPSQVGFNKSLMAMLLHLEASPNNYVIFE